MRTEDEIRDFAKIKLGFDKSEKGVKQGTGQITTFNQLGFKGISNKPDGWYLPDDIGSPAIILETKSEREDIYLQKWVDELKKNVDIVLTKYKNVCGILYNGVDVRVFKNNIEIEKYDVSDALQDKSYYLSLFVQNKIDKQRIYKITKRINDCLHFDFGIKNLYHRMIFTACALVAKRYNAMLVPGMNFALMKNSVLDTMKSSLEENRKLNLKLDLLIEVYDEIKMNTTTNQDAIDAFISCVSEISECVNSEHWNGEDVMGIFFNEFNRYKKKSENGQVFTPDHITSFMYRLIGVNKNDVVLDAACGSGAFLVKAMCNMIKESGGVNTQKASEIRQEQLFGIEFDREIYALACANMLIHKDGKTNLEHLDSRSSEACEWIKKNNITKVLMNPPFESKYGCLVIVDNVLKNVPLNTKCAFILPDKKLEKDRIGKKLLKHSTLEKIIKLPEKTFAEGVTVSVFVFTAGVPQDEKEIFACYIEDDGLETVKNQGRQDIRDRWQGVEDKWIDIIRKQSGDDTIQWIKPSVHLSYQVPEKPFEINEEDFKKTVMDYLMFNQGFDVKEFSDALIKRVLYSGETVLRGNDVNVVFLDVFNFAPDSSRIKRAETNSIKETLDTVEWKPYRIGDMFVVEKGKRLTKANMRDGDIRFIGASSANNGITAYIANNQCLHSAGTITLTYNGSVGEAFYQNEPFWASDDVNVLYPKFNMTENIAMFIIPILKKVGAKYAFIDKWKKENMENDSILLPSADDDQPDYDYMERFVSHIRKRVETDLVNLSKIIGM